MSVDQTQKSRAVVIAFSGRALAEACHRAGFRTLVFDQFGDRDTQQAGVHVPISFAEQESNLVEQLRPYESDLRAADAIILGGGCENRPKLLGYLAQQNGNSLPTVQQIAQCRSLVLWQEAARAAGCQVPAVLDDLAARAPEPSNWLLKPRHSGGGIGIKRLTDADLLTTGVRASCSNRQAYLQRLIAGQHLGATCILSDRGVELLAATESLTQDDWLGPTEFIYRGSLGPVDLARDLQETILAIAQYCWQTTGLRGWLQLDLILDAAGRLWLLELNPRWTAGMEVLVESNHACPLQQHLQAQGVILPSQSPSSERFQFAKAIYYAPHDLPLTGEVMRQLNALSTEEFGDLPSATLAEQVIPAGHPVLTIKARLSQSASRAELLRELNCKRKRMDLIFAP